jgi:Isochorismatase family
LLAERHSGISIDGYGSRNEGFPGGQDRLKRSLMNSGVATEHWCSSGFANTDLDLQLKKRGIHQLIVIGLIAHTCIEATVRYAAELGYEVTVVKDATADYSDEMMHAALDINLPKGKVVVSPCSAFSSHCCWWLQCPGRLSTRRRPAPTQNCTLRSCATRLQKQKGAGRAALCALFPFPCAEGAIATAIQTRSAAFA